MKRNDPMHECVDGLAGGLLNVEEDLGREFEARLVESSTLAFRVAFSVLRQRQDAEDVAQEAFVKAYRNFTQLRDRQRFRAWLVRMTWRLAIDRQRTDRRRASRELKHGEPSTTPTTAEEVASRERAAQLWGAIDALPDKLRVVVVLAGIEGHAHPQRRSVHSIHDRDRQDLRRGREGRRHAHCGEVTDEQRISVIARAAARSTPPCTRDRRTTSGGSSRNRS